MKRRPSVQFDWLYVAGLAVLAALFAAGVAAAIRVAPDEVEVRVLAVDGALRPSSDGRSIIRGGEGLARPARATIAFSLPQTDVDDARWVVWVGRGPVDAISLHAGGWSSTTRDFFAPSRVAGLLPSAYVFPLPTDWTGDIRLEVDVRGGLPGAMRVKVMREGAAMRLEQRGAVLAALVYGCMFTLMLLMLALYGAARDRVFLLFFGTGLLALLVLAAVNGHVYQLPVLAWLSVWRSQGLWALALLFCASVLQLLLRYAATPDGERRAKRVVQAYSLVLSGAAAVCLLGRPDTLPWVAVAGPWLAFAAILLGVGIVLDAAMRGVRMAWTLSSLLLAATFSLLVTEVALPGRWADPVWLRYGYELVLAAAAAALAVGMVGRIGEYRDQRDQDRLARADSEKRMRREAARADFNVALQATLRTLGQGDVEWAAFKLLLEHLMPLVPVRHAAVVVHGFHGKDLVVPAPQSAQAEIEAVLAARGLALKRQASTRVPLQQPVTAADRNGVIAIEGIVPLAIHAPGSGMVLLSREGDAGFTGDELALAGELSRLALVHIEQAVAAINLRRSAELDALTGTFNRRTIDQWLQRCFSDADRDGRPVSVLFVDLDHFKSINDRHGHAAGDECLRQVAAALQRSLPETGLLGRYGGEEFIVVLPGQAGAEGRVTGERLRQAVEEHGIAWQGQVLRLTVSVGMATRLASEDAPAATVDRADKALYAAKRGGRNCIHVAPAVFS